MAKKPKIDWRRLGREARTFIAEFYGSLREFGRITGMDKGTLSRIQRGHPVDTRNFLWICKECSMNPWTFFVW